MYILFSLNPLLLAVPTVTIAFIEHINASAIRIEWTLDNMPQPRIITGYTLRYTATETDSTLTVSTTGSLNYAVLTGLMPYTNYTMMIRMKTKHGNGQWSNSSQFMTASSGQC